MSANTQILAIGGGKGGVGKSFVASSLAMDIAEAGHNTIIIDLDLGGANLHTLFGINTTNRGIGDFIYTPSSGHLEDYAVSCGIQNLRLISGNGFIPGIANLAYQQKVKVLKAVSRLNAEYVILDLGAGTSYNVIDFFSITQSGIVVTISEPTAILNAYEFLKNVFYRMLQKTFRNDRAVLHTIDDFKISRDEGEVSSMQSLIATVSAIDQKAAETMRNMCRDFRPGLILNMSREGGDALGKNLVDICKSFLDVDPVYLGAVPYDEVVHECLQQMKSAALEFPESPPNQALKKIARTCMVGHWMDRNYVNQLREDADGTDATPAAQADDHRIRQVLAGHDDAELSGLLSGFLSEYSSHRTEETVQEKQEPTAATTVSPDAVTSPSAWLDLEPRLDVGITLPRFARKQGEKSDRVSWFRRLFGSKAGQQQAARIRAIPQAENIALAIGQTSAATAHNHENGQAWMHTGLQLLDHHQLYGAQQAFARAHACLPENPDVANNLGACMLASGRIQPARQALLAGIGLAPKHVLLRFNLGLVQLALHEYRAAYQCFHAVRGQDDRNVAALFLSALCLLHQKDYRKAQGQFQNVISQDATDLAARFNLGICQFKRQLFTEAIETFTAVLVIAPEDGQALAGRGLAHWEAGHNKQALEDMQAALDADPANLGYRAAHGSMSLMAGRLDKAFDDIRTISDLLPQNQRYQILLKEIRERIGSRQ